MMHLKHWFETFAPHGKTPSNGMFFQLKDHAHTLEDIANTYGDTFYHGRIASLIDAFSRKHNGYIRATDLKKF
jgi:gamma-glutamyltranspeptidase / glutathione hydrolase